MFTYQHFKTPTETPTDVDESQSNFPDSESLDYALRSDDRIHLYDPIANELLATKAMERLKDVGFLGAIDYVRKGNGKAAHRRRHNRLEHSTGVALLAQKFAFAAEMPERDRLTLIAASLLHDVGHGPLSHTLEPVFEEALEINHHRATENIIKGGSVFGNEIRDVLFSYKLDVEEIISLIDGKHTGSYGYLFSGKINLDTLEGITRCRAIVGRRPAFGTAVSIVERWARSGDSQLPKSDFDDFWRLKHDVYALIINSTMGLTMDTIAQAWARENMSRITSQDFHLNERQLREKYPELFFLINSAANDREKLKSNIPAKWMNASVQARKRYYYIDETEELTSLEDMSRRYKDEKRSWTVSLREILE